MTTMIFWGSVATIAYAYVGYPLLLALTGPFVRFRRSLSSGEEPDPSRRPAPTPFVSCIVPALDEAERIVAKINNLHSELATRRYEIIVVDDGSSDNTAERVTALADDRVRVISHSERRGKPSALNTGVAASKGGVLVLSDADVLVSAGSIEAMLARLSTPGVGIVGAGRKLSGAGDALAEAEGLYWRYEQFIQERESDLGACVAMSGAILTMDRSLFGPLPTDVINDDFYLAMQTLRSGAAAQHEPQATAMVGVASDAAAERRRRRRIVAGRWQAIARARTYLPWRRPLPLWEVWSHKLLRPMVPFAFLASLVTSALTVFAPARFASLLGRGMLRYVPFGGHVAFLLLAAIGLVSERQSSRQEGSHQRSSQQRSSQQKGSRICSLAAFLVSSNRAAAAGLVGYVSGSQTARWQRAPSPHELESNAMGGNP